MAFFWLFIVSRFLWGILNELISVLNLPIYYNQEVGLDLVNIQSLLESFIKDRDLEKYHSPKNLAMAMSVEVSELVEIFQWMTEKESSELNEIKLFHASQEVADVFIYLVMLSMKLDIDLEKAVLEKIELNKEKYPKTSSY